MKFTQNMSKTNKIIISAILGAGVALGIGFVAGVSNTTAAATIEQGGVSMTMTMTTGFANFGKMTTAASNGGENMETDLNPDGMSFGEFIKDWNSKWKDLSASNNERLTQLESEYADAPEATKPLIATYIELQKANMKVSNDANTNLNTSYTLMIVGSILLGVFGVAGIAWSTVLILDKRNKTA